VKRNTIAVLLLAAVSCVLWAANQESPGFTIRYFDQKVYFLGDPIVLQVQVSNTGTDTLQLNVADNRYFNLDFDVRTLTNVGVNHSQDFTTQRTSDQPVFFRGVSLQPGEMYSFTVDLTRYIGFTAPGQYVVQGSFFPDLFRGPQSAALYSNRLSLNIKPPNLTEEQKQVVEAETGALLARQSLPPDEVVTWTIGARQKSQWERFFLYLDLESLLRRNPDKDRVFRQSTEAAQRQMIDQFKTQLMQTTINQEISVIPTSFDIQKTSYDASQATVQVLERFQYPDYTDLKAYTYYLKKSDRYWIIYDYDVKNQGTL